MKQIVYVLMILLIASTLTMADRPLEQTDVLDLLRQLCQQPMSGWIQQGRIEGVHLSSDSTSHEPILTQESVITDGDRFSWNIKIVPQDKTAAMKQRSDNFLAWNQDRTFTWDGSLYTLYFNPGNHAIVYENPTIPVTVTGPLKAGFIPWGSGIFSYENLTSGPLSGKQVQTDQGLRLYLSAQPNDDVQMEFVLDPDKANAVLSYTKLRAGSKTLQTYTNFIEHAGRWIPMSITINQYYQNQLLSYDNWGLTLLKDEIPADDSFQVLLRQDAMVERHSPFLKNPVFYRHTKERDIQPLLEKRFIAALKKGVQKENCATVAAAEILSAFGISVTDAELESLVRNDSDMTSLSQVQQLMQKKGLFCLPVKTDTAGLARFENDQVMLHLPRKKHFVVLDRIDNNNVWLIDLDRQTFYHRMKRARFEQEWAGIALVVSDQPLSLGKDDKPVPDAVSQKIIGAADYSCRLIQGGIIEFCPKMIMGTCGGRYTIWEAYYACQPDSDGGFCAGTERVGGQYSPCVESMESPVDCDITGDFYAQPIRMCKP